MNFIGNLLWLICGGILLAIAWTVAGLAMCITVIGIPFGMQCFKIAGLMLSPFGKEVELGNFGVGGLILNLIWILFLGWELAIGHLITGIILCVTVVGIPFGLQHIKFAKLALVPFGSQINYK